MAAEPDALGLALFVGSSVHIAATGWLFTFSEVRTIAAAHPRRFIVVPACLVTAASGVGAVLSPRQRDLALVGFFAWQLFHYQKQNLGIAALAARRGGVAPLHENERRLILVAGWAGALGLLLRPGVLQLTDVTWRVESGFGLAALVAILVAFAGGITVFRRPASERPARFVSAYLTAVCFPLPIFAFTSPYLAIGGLTIVHGLQYLGLVGRLTAGPSGARRLAHVAPYAAVVVAGGVAINLASHLDRGSTMLARLGFGAYLGVVMTHFVVDAGVWRMRDPVVRGFIAARLDPICIGRRSMVSPWRTAASAVSGGTPVPPL